jgi:hypothetical protein
MQEAEAATKTEKRKPEDHTENAKTPRERTKAAFYIAPPLPDPVLQWRRGRFRGSV